MHVLFDLNNRSKRNKIRVYIHHKLNPQKFVLTKKRLIVLCSNSITLSTYSSSSSSSYLEIIFSILSFYLFEWINTNIKTFNLFFQFLTYISITSCYTVYKTKLKHKGIF